MATIGDMLSRFDAIDIDAQAKVIISTSADILIGYNQEQLQSGRYKQGDFLAPYRSKYYAALKLKLNPAGVTDLRLTGEYYRSLYLKVDQETFSILSDDEKDTLLTDLYGADIKGVSAENKIEFGNTIVQPAMVKYLKDTLKL